MVIFSKNISFPVKILLFKRVSQNFGFSRHVFLKKKYIPYSLQIHRFYFTSNPLQNKASTKGWKSVARDGHKDDKKFLSCEEGTDAVPHHILMGQLQDCHTVSDQIKTFCSSISILSKEVENRKEFCESLKELFQPFFPKFKVNLFGSSINGLGFKGCDVDVSIQTMFSEKEYADVKEVPTLESVMKGEVSTETVAHLQPTFLLRFIRRILRAHCPDVHEPIFLVKARCPILRFYNAKYDVFCDFSCENHASMLNTKVIRLLSHLDERFSPLTKIIRYWGKHGGFVGDVDLFNSYSFSLLVVHFLQLTNPPVLPSIKDIIEKSEYLRHGEIDDDELLLNDLNKFKPSENTQTIEELLREYFFHYLTFDYSQIMLPLVSSSMPKTDFIPDATEGPDAFEFSVITIQDPFRLNNASVGAQFKACKNFLYSISEACKSFQNEEIWHPSADNWGICSLFQGTLSDQEVFMKKLYDCSTHTIKLPLKTDVSLISRILHEGLLVECSESFIVDEMPQPSMKLNCKIYYDTWTGRTYKNCPSTLTNQLERENWISKHLLKNKKESRKQLLLTFSCACFENTRDNQLNVVLTFERSKYRPVVAIFLKEYIPSMCKKLM